MSDQSRSMIMKRRSSAIANLSKFSVTKDGLTFDEALRMGIYKVNSTAQVGIATATETGLEMGRFPVRVIIAGADTGRLIHDVDTCVSYWPLATAALGPVPFQRRPLSSDIAINNLYKHFPDFDKDMWDCYNEAKRSAVRQNKTWGVALDATQETNRNEFYALLCVPNPTDAQRATMQTLLTTICSAAVATGTPALLKVTTDQFIVINPHGRNMMPPTGMTADSMVLKEVGLTILVNSMLMKARHESASDGSIAFAAYSAAAMFRAGLYEEYEHREYVTVTVTHSATDAYSFTVSAVDAPEGYDIPGPIQTGQILSINGLRYDPILAQLGNMAVFLSGLMHYMFNHTTGGTRVSGPLLSLCSMYTFMESDLSNEEQTEITSLIYEAVHPTNKRAIANIFFKKSRVYTHGRSQNAIRYEKFETDAFADIRRDPHPAGAHKAVMCAQALRRVLMSGLAPFLPWASSIQSVVEICRSVLSQGAFAHIGSNYYTGHSPVSQASALDMYLPDLARYMHTFHALDSLTASPHMGPDIAAKSDAKWSAMLRDIKGKDISGVSSDIVQAFLAATGVGSFGFDPEDQNTWATADQRSREALEIINGLHV